MQLSSAQLVRQLGGLLVSGGQRLTFSWFLTESTGTWPLLWSNSSRLMRQWHRLAPPGPPTVSLTSTPTSLPTQKQVSRALHHVTAADLLQGLINSESAAASWHISYYLPGSGSWLHSMPYIAGWQQRYGGRCFVFALWLHAIPEAVDLDQCVPVCSCAGWQLHFGFQWMSACEKLLYNTVGHNAVAVVLSSLRKLFRKIGWETRLKGQAGWMVPVGAPDMRPFDAPAQPGPSTP